MNQRSPISRVLGLGSAKDGTEHFWVQRLTAIALLPLGLWFVFSVAGMAGAGTLDYPGVVRWLSSPSCAVLAILLIATMAYHSALGVQVVLEDYVGSHWLKVSSLIAAKMAHVLVAAIGIFSIFRISFGSVI